MAYRLKWSPTARQDLRDLVAYIAEDDRVAAGRFTRGVFQVMGRLRSFPQSGRVVPEFEDVAIREVIRSPCRIVYRINHAEQTVEIARVWHGARGLPKL